MTKVNRLTVCKEDYKSYAEFRNAITDAIMVLLNNGYIMTVKYDVCDKELGIVVIDFNYADEEYGDRLPCWLLPEEEESVIYKKE